MPIGNEELLKLTQALKSPLPEEREQAADSVTDVINSLSREETRIITLSLAEAAADETSHSCRESALHAIAELVDTGFIRRTEILPLAAIDRRELVGSQKEYMEYLDEEVK